MKVLVLAGSLALFGTWAHAEILAEWNFNGRETPSRGNGSATVIGATSFSYAAGSPSDTETNNLAWNTASYPTQGTSNKTAGVELRVSTEGYSDVSLDWEQRLSATASKYLRLQYASDGVNFTDLPDGIVASDRTLTFERKTLRLAGVPGVDDNPLLALRLVAEFESTASGSGTAGYVTTYGTNSYSRSGTIRYDLITVTGTLIAGANTPPEISDIPNQTLRVGQLSAPLQFVISDQQDPAENLVVTAVASDDAVVAAVMTSGTAAEREVRIKGGDVAGTATVTLTVHDVRGRSSSTGFGVTVLPLNTAPSISAIAGTNVICCGRTEPIEFFVGDLESSAETLILSGTSANPALVPSDGAHIAFGGTGSNRTVTVSPAESQAGVAPITVIVSDGLSQASSSFAVVVRPAEPVLLYDPFDYAEGSVCTNSGFLWRTRSGTEGDCHVRASQLELAGSRTEDVIASLPGGPYTRSNGTVLYASFRFRFVSTPKATPEYFAHFVGGSALRGRIYAGAADVWPGAFHLYVANGSETNKALPWNLSTNTSYTVLTRYDVDSAQTTLWLNPSAESDPGTVAIDTVPPVAVNAYGFRQDSGLGATVAVDDLKVGLSFGAVTSTGTGTETQLGIEWTRGAVVLRWPTYTAVLQASDSVDGGFIDIPGATSPYTNALEHSARFFRLRVE